MRWTVTAITVAVAGFMSTAVSAADKARPCIRETSICWVDEECCPGLACVVTQELRIGLAHTARCVSRKIGFPDEVGS
ncbi:hypothetical protein XA68_17272 [Ophiocordyceps unilateralis]|uniref:Extracellular membrane protein CFEM domain-containing protein n=1 Tax=Ophiocordyceps unilateralis TaxID=268505 RepID=A0A2A9PS55_OPHUN|nr:hypothetical protein XA68_17272 [Ophiocordyceps unilateralis]